ncbi:hypothetical protein ABIB82_004156 [Bradyrhizobium sp. i1.8.4]
MTSAVVSPARRCAATPSVSGRIFEYASFQVNDDPGPKLIIYTEIG